MPTPKTDELWYKDAIIYELHVKAFNDSNGDGTGDFRGLIDKLDYIRDLGVTAVWLLPFYPSPFKDDGYDISDFRGVHPAFGNLRDFRALIREAHRRGLKIITELVINHTSDQHPWFQAARRANRNSARRKFYVWSDSDSRFPETRIIFTDTESSNWAWDPEAGAYYWHRFFSHQPDLNHNNPRVVQAVLKTMRFWLDLGVDGLRLDAVPYLCVREGTNNENLPETHAVLRHFRRYLDQHYTARMFLAEANQWPEDVLPYFGDGDQCHMAFHFPLMPRMFMALRQEDRLPITDILARTPPIPESCQWALFLRNHDELTLEMVTDAERDYMYREYARDDRMRLNLGIRRRLAPLLDNSRRRMELLNSLLFSMPGSPIIYYGDELGMGDNVFLGDRNGVRTPMQWNPDRNGGFSRADPARLYLPPIMDPVYGYQAVNVEAQERDPSSMLHFMRRMIALRRQHKAFSRGTMEFLHPENRTILAYLRSHLGEIILVVANLSRFVQPAELDLSRLAGRIPVEMIGRTEFPAVGELPYFVTLGPHSFYWFRLEQPAEPIRVGTAKTGRELRPQLPQLALESDWTTLLQPEFLYGLGNDILPPFLRDQRWFRGKAKDLATCSLIDWCKLGASFYLTFLRVQYASGEEETYVLPLKIAHGGPARALAAEIPESIVATVKGRRGEGILYDALMDRASCDILFTALGDGRRYNSARGGTFRTRPTGTASELLAGVAPCDLVRKLGVEQSNTSVIIDDAFVLKLYRKLEEGENPDVEISLYLTEKTDFSACARVVGTLEYIDKGGRKSTVGMLQEFVTNRGDGWVYTLAGLAGFYRRAGEENAPPPSPPDGPWPVTARPEIPEVMTGLAGPYLDAIATLGQRTAEFHLALARERKDPAFRPEKATPAFTEHLAEAMTWEAKEALALLSGAAANLDPATRRDGDRVLTEGPALLGRIDDLAGLGEELGTLIRHHGDYHLGQVLRTVDDFILLDFEGEPLRPLAARRAKGSPLKDVAGLLRSLHYAAHSGMPAAITEEERRNLVAWGRAWYQWCGAIFTAAYFEAAAGAPFLPKNATYPILRVFLLEKIFYELKYELNNRPDWVHIPLAGIVELLEGNK